MGRLIETTSDFEATTISSSAAGAFDCANDGASFIAAFGELALSDRVGDDAGARLDMALLAIHEESADGDAGVEVAVEICV